MSYDSLKLTYFSLVYQYQLYGSVVWGGGYKIDLNYLFQAHRKVNTDHDTLVALYTQPNYYYTWSYCNHQISFTYQTGLFVYNAMNVFSTNCGFNYVVQNERRPDTIRVPLCRTSYAQRNVIYKDQAIRIRFPMIWGLVSYIIICL